MGLITIQLFRSEDSALSVLQQLEENPEINSDTEEDCLVEELTAIALAAPFERASRAIPPFCTAASPFVKRLPPTPPAICGWAGFFAEAAAGGVVEFLGWEERQVIRQVSRGLRRTVTLRTLQNENNWNLTMALLAPLLLQETHLKESGYEEEYEHSEDLERTSGYFENHNTEDVAEQQGRLDRIITALSFRVKYFQGIMPICAALLQCFNEHTSYWLLRLLLFKSRYVQLDLPTYHAFLATLDRELRVLLPEVAAHLEASGFEANYFVMKWIMGLFAEDMAKPMVLAVWDLLCQTDLLVLVYVVAAIFHCLAHEILLASPDEINDILKTALRDKLAKLKSEDLVGIAKHYYIVRVLHGDVTLPYPAAPPPRR